jgi:hypothetical protein
MHYKEVVVEMILPKGEESSQIVAAFLLEDK